MSAVCVRREGRAVEIELNACCDWPAFYFSELYGLWLLVEAARARFIMCGPDGHIRDADGDYIYPRLQRPGQLPQAFADQQELAFHTLSGSKDQAARRAFSAPYIRTVSYTGRGTGSRASVSGRRPAGSNRERTRRPPLG
jgi:hypothetical protein